jgi:hypothetical protein
VGVRAHAGRDAAPAPGALPRHGQIAGSRTSGVWNPIEHFAFLVKSAQALRASPDFDGVLQWVPVGQPWKEMSPVLADALDISPDRIVPFRDWVKLVRRSPLHPETENPAARLIDFLDHNFERTWCGGLILDTTNAQEHSKAMAAQGPVSAEVARRYVGAWKKMGYLNS